MTEEISIVHEYQILYSNRIRQKDKKWNDGKLQFYEFNSKLQVFNEDNNLISTDFIRDKPVSFILNTILEDENEFVMPSNKYIIQIQEKMRVFERDITFKKRSQVKQEQVTSRGSTQSPKAKMGSKQRTPIKQEPANEKERIIVKSEHQIITSDPRISKKSLGLVTFTNTDLRIKIRHPIRVPPKSSIWFKYINTPNYDSIESQSQAPSIKQEPVFDSGTSVEQANIIYDLSDFEEDERFADMLKQHQQKKSITPTSNYNQAHEFDLSSQSDFDDVDL